MRSDRKELKTLVRVQDLNHEALRMINKIKPSRNPKRVFFETASL